MLQKVLLKFSSASLERQISPDLKTTEIVINNNISLQMLSNLSLSSVF